MMAVKINEDLTFKIGHKTQMGYANGIFDYGNPLRVSRGLKPFDDLHDLIRRRSFWEFVIGISTEDTRKAHNKVNGEIPIANISANYTLLDGYIDAKGRVKLKAIMKCFPNLIKSQVGGHLSNRGYWMDLRLLLKVATMLDPQLEAQIYDVFINGKILEYRDEGGTNFNKFKQLLKDKFSINKTEESSLIFSRALRENIFGREVVTEFRKEYPKDNIWNSDLATDAIQEKRTKLEDKLCMLVEEGFIMDADTLLAYISKNFSLPKPRESSFDNVEFKY